MIKISEEGKARLLKVAEAIEKESEHFLMENYDFQDVGALLSCDSAACICGWLVHLEGKEEEAATRARAQEAKMTGLCPTSGWDIWSQAGYALLAVDAPVWREKDLALFHDCNWPNGYRYDFTGDRHVITKGWRPAWAESWLEWEIDEHNVRILEAREENAKVAAQLLRDVAKAGGVWWQDTDGALFPDREKPEGEKADAPT